MVVLSCTINSYINLFWYLNNCHKKKKKKQQLFTSGLAMGHRSFWATVLGNSYCPGPGVSSVDYWAKQPVWISLLSLFLFFPRIKRPAVKYSNMRSPSGSSRLASNRKEVGSLLTKVEPEIAWTSWVPWSTMIILDLQRRKRISTLEHGFHLPHEECTM